MYSFLVKRYMCTFLVTKDMQPIISTCCYLGPGFSYLRNSVCLIVVTCMGVGRGSREELGPPGF